MTALPDPTRAIRRMALDCTHLFDVIAVDCDSSILSSNINSEAYLPKAEERSPFTFLSTQKRFDFWTHINGVISPKPSSLHFEPEGSRIYVEAMLEYLGIMLKDLAFIYNFLRKPSVGPISEFIKTFERVTTNLQIVVRRLYGLANDIRLLWTQHVNRTKQATFSHFTVEDKLFQGYITYLVRHRFPAAGAQLHTTLGESIAVRRRKLLNKFLHAKRITPRLAPGCGPLVEKHDEEILPSAPLYASLPIQQRAPHRPEGPPSGISKAVRPDASGKGFESMQLPKTEAFPRMISTVLLSNEESFEYPPIPATAKGQTRIQCPFCSDELELGSDPSKAWKDHIHHDIMSYPCLHPKCADAFTFFATPTEWKAHMQTRHDSNWVYEVSPNWYCNIDHEPQTFNTELEWRQHMTDTNGHDFIQAYFEILVDDMNETVPYSKFLCPLCKKYPENTEHLLGKDNTSPELISNLLLDHIVSHLESLSSKALPSLQHPDYITGLPSGKKAIYGALSPDEIGQFSVRRGNIVGTEYDHQQCLFCGTNALSGAISPHTVRRLLPPGAISRGLVYGYLKACLGCVQKLMRRADRPLGDFDRRTLHGNKSPDYGHVKVTADEIDRISFNLWVSWQERPECSGYRTMDPILVDLASHSAFTNLRQPFSQVLYPKARSPNFTRDSSLKIMADAVRTGNVQAACWLIDNGSSVDMIDQHGMSPLLWAAVLGHEEMVQLLLKKKAKIEIRDTFNRTPLSLAALGDHKGIVDLLLRSGANVDSYDSSDLTSLFWAVVAGRISVVQSLLAFGARYQDADQFFSMPYSRDEESGDGKYSSRTAFRPMSLIDSTKMECITSAIEKGDEKAVHELIDQVHGIHGFNIDSKKTILDFAIEAGNWPITLSLLQYDAERLQPGSVARARRLVEANKRMVEASSVVD